MSPKTERDSSLPSYSDTPKKTTLYAWAILALGIFLATSLLFIGGVIGRLLINYNL